MSEPSPASKSSGSWRDLLNGFFARNVYVVNSVVDYVWAGAGVAGAPPGNKLGDIGVNNDMVPTSNVYVWDNTAWKDTGATFKQYFGG